MTTALMPLRGHRAHGEQMVNRLLCKRCGLERKAHYNPDGTNHWPESDLCERCHNAVPVDGSSRAVWVPLAACRTLGGIDVFEEAGEALTEPAGHKKAVVQEAKSYCAECPVIRQCLAFAMKHEGPRAQERWGVQGGLTPKERERRYYASRVEA